jgi:hypothetical protein
MSYQVTTPDNDGATPIRADADAVRELLAAAASVGRRLHIRPHSDPVANHGTRAPEPRP